MDKLIKRNSLRQCLLVAMLTMTITIIMATAFEVRAQPADAIQLDVGLLVFDANLSTLETQSKDRAALVKIRSSEANYIPYVLRQVLIQSDHWGVVRVLPEIDSSAELLVAGKILESNGLVLSLHILAVDSTGREWLNKEYTQQSLTEDYSRPAGGASALLFAELYTDIEKDLYAVVSQIGKAERQKIRDISWLRYAIELVPDAFSSHLSKNDQGRWELRRLPARGDPMVTRINRVRAYQLLFIDTIDEQYAALYDDMTPAYDMWRKYDREQSLYLDAYRERIEDRKKKPRGSFEGMKQTYNNYKWAKIQEQESAELAVAFNRELQPTTLALEGNVIKLEGSLEERYREWHRILADIHLLETQ